MCGGICGLASALRCAPDNGNVRVRVAVFSWFAEHRGGVRDEAGLRQSCGDKRDVCTDGLVLVRAGKALASGVDRYHAGNGVFVIADLKQILLCPRGER